MNYGNKSYRSIVYDTYLNTQTGYNKYCSTKYPKNNNHYNNSQSVCNYYTKTSIENENGENHQYLANTVLAEKRKYQRKFPEREENNNEKNFGMLQNTEILSQREKPKEIYYCLPKNMSFNHHNINNYDTNNYFVNLMTKSNEKNHCRNPNLFNDYSQSHKILASGTVDINNHKKNLSLMNQRKTKNLFFNKSKSLLNEFVNPKICDDSKKIKSDINKANLDKKIIEKKNLKKMGIPLKQHHTRLTESNINNNNNNNILISIGPNKNDDYNNKNMQTAQKKIDKKTLYRNTSTKLVSSNRNINNKHNHSLHEIKAIKISKNSYEKKKLNNNIPFQKNKIPLTKININDSNKYNNYNIYSYYYKNNHNIYNSNKGENETEYNIKKNIKNIKSIKNNKNTKNINYNKLFINTKSLTTPDTNKTNKILPTENKNNSRVSIFDNKKMIYNKKNLNNQKTYAKVRKYFNNYDKKNKPNEIAIDLTKINNSNKIENSATKSKKDKKCSRQKSRTKHSHSIKKLDKLKKFKFNEIIDFPDIKNNFIGMKKHHSSIKFKNPLTKIDFNYKAFEEDFVINKKIDFNDNIKDLFKNLKPQISFRVTLNNKNNDKNKNKRFYRVNYFYSENIRGLKTSVNNRSTIIGRI